MSMFFWTWIVLNAFLACVGHAYIWTSILNFLYARPYPKPLLRLWRLFTGLVILAFPIVFFSLGSRIPYGVYLAVGSVCVVFGYSYLVLNLLRYFRKPPAVLLSESTTTLDLRQELGAKAIGDGNGRLAAKVPGNGMFRVDFTELTLRVPHLPPQWDGLTILHLTDLHYHGTPSREWHERVMAEIESRWPTNDLVCLTGDYVDTDAHHAWIGPLLGRFRGIEGNFAILGNHDQNHDPERLRAVLADAGYTALGNGWREAAIRGMSCIFIGHEGPWFSPPPNLTGAPPEPFRMCLSHTPDNVFWAREQGINLVLCGHVHGGQIRLPFIGSIFVPSIYGRQFDMGVFEANETVMVVGRGLAGKEPLRFRCNPQVIRLTLRGFAS